MIIILKKSKLCYGPMSKNIVDVIINFSNKYEIPITIIPSRRQIEWNGGYVNNWNTEEFCNYVKSKSKYIALQRDHAGPGQGCKDDDGYVSLEYDCKYFDSIHIDPWKKYPRFEDGLKWTIDMINFCYQINKNLYFEVGTEEAIRKFKCKEIDIFLERLKKELKKEIFDRIIFCVIQSGTALQDGKNIGNYDNNKLIEMLDVTKKYNLLSKEHTGDYMEENIIKERFKCGLDNLNIAPEIGVYETKIILDKLNEEQILEFYNICLKSNKWVKWVNSHFVPEENKIKLIEICGHYQFSKKEFINIKNKILNIDDTIQKELFKYFINIFNIIKN